MSELELEGYDVVASQEENVVYMSSSVLEFALNLLQYQVLSGDDIESIWKEMEFERHGDKVLAPRRTFERLEAILADPETQARISQNVERLMAEGPDDTQGESSEDD